ncbi:MAG: hypothetical protein ABSC05_39405, partial [Candidatus Solibacter sp.]
LQTILDGVEENLNSRMFMFIPRDQACYYDKPDVIGRKFVWAFSRGPKQAIFEMSEACRCYAVSRWTACVFHCMRVTEFGLRKLFRLAGAKLPIKGSGGPHSRRSRYHIEFATWDVVITQIRKKISDCRTRNPGDRREQRLQFFSALVDHCEYMKDMWRNEVSHTRRVYNKEEALAAISRVHDFMELVASTPPK